MYTVKIGIRSVSAARWSGVVEACSGKIDSLVELLQGKISKSVMEIVTHMERGLFPSPKEISLSCSCPDWATMCKHVAAVMYGVGARLDEEPALLFQLRGVDPTGLFTVATVRRATGASRRAKGALADNELGAVFGIDIDEGTPARPRSKGVATRTPSKRTPTRPRGASR